MLSLTPAGLFAALRHRRAQRHPELLEAARRAWDAWCETAATQLPSQGKPRVLIAAKIHCVEDVVLHTGLLQLLSIPNVQPLVLFVLPSAAALSVVHGQALREGWGSLVSLRTTDEMGRLVPHLPGDMPLAVFSAPACLSAATVGGLEKALFRAESDAAWIDRISSPSEFFLGRAREFCATGWAFDEILDLPSAHRLLETLEVLETDFGPLHTISCSDRPARTQNEFGDTKIQFHADKVELSPVCNSALLAITMNAEGESPRVIALQPSFLANSQELSVPVLPRHASEIERRVQIHVFSDNDVRVTQALHANVPPSSIEPWMLSAFLNRGGGGNPVIKAFAAGTGCRLTYAEDEPDELRDVPVVWGVLRGSDRILAQAQLQGLHFFYIDHAYFNRGHGKSYRITRSRFEAGKVRRVAEDRLQRLELKIEPWRKGGRSIIVCPPTDYFMAAHDCADWLEKTLATLQLETDRPIIIREKPQPGHPAIPLAQVLHGAHALVTHSSNVAIEAACLGTPVFVSQTSAAAPIGRTDVGLIERPVYPDRKEWLRHLAYSQYTIEEIRDGSAWNLLKYLEGCEFV